MSAQPAKPLKHTEATAVLFKLDPSCCLCLYFCNLTRLQAGEQQNPILKLANNILVWIEGDGTETLILSLGSASFTVLACRSKPQINIQISGGLSLIEPVCYLYITLERLVPHGVFSPVLSPCDIKRTKGHFAASNSKALSDCSLLLKAELKPKFPDVLSNYLC